MSTQLEQLKASVRKADGLLSLTDLWKLAGADENKSPYKWSRTDIAKGVMAATARFLKRDSESLFKTTKGKNGGTWANELILVEYAQYLNPELAVLVNAAFLERVEEEQNPELAVKRGNERAARTWAKQGHDEAWIGQRIVSIAARKTFTGVLKAHGVEREGYRNCTNAVYGGIFGGTSAVVRQKLDIEKRDNIRDNMSLLQLSATQLVEAMAAEEIQQQDLRGNASCEQACTKASRIVATAIVQNRRR